MDIYHYHPVTGELVAPGKADPDPLQEGEWLVPANATNIEPPATGEDEAAIFDGAAWQVVTDHRGRIYWLDDGTRHEIAGLGVEPPAEALDEAPPEPLDQRATQQRMAIDAARYAAFAAGMAHDFPDGTTDAVQTRPEDKANLLGIAIEARDLRDGGITDPLIEFRGASNETHVLTADQAIAMTNAALSHIKAIYERSWQRKDAIAAALEAEDREGVEAVVW